jgi:OOP family OmpA-OmpF porin
MNPSKLVLCLAAAGMVAASGPVLAEVEQPYHLTGQFGGIRLDDARNTNDDGLWWSVGFGRFFGDHFSLDVEYDEFSGDYADYAEMVPGATFDQWGLKNIGLMGRYHFGNAAVRPFLGGGIGQQKHRNVMDTSWNSSFSVGAGIRGQLAKHLGAQLQVLYRLDLDGESLDNKKYRDLIYSIGFSFDFGGKEPPPPPPPPPAAPPPPPPNPDLDGDGVINEHDKCPNTRPGAVVDLDGCEVEAVIELEGVHFDFDKATLKPEAKAILDEAAALLNKHERVVVEVAGHTDSMGPDEYNQGLSERRANSVRDYLVEQGVRASRLSAKGYGEGMPVASNDTKEGRAENRRVELVVLDR